MSVFESENDLANSLSKVLEPKFKKVYKNVNLASHKFYQGWEKLWGESPPIAQPQIDLILVPQDLKLHAVELKYYRPRKNSPTNWRWRYYSGIDESLALLKFGFASASLWHFFDAKIPEAIMKSYFRDCWSVITALELKIWCKAFRVHDRYNFKEMARMSYIEMTPDFSPYGSNPLLGDKHAKRAADFIRKALRIPSP